MRRTVVLSVVVGLVCVVAVGWAYYKFSNEQSQLASTMTTASMNGNQFFSPGNSIGNTNRTVIIPGANTAP